MPVVVTNFEVQVLTQFEQTLLGLGGTVPDAPPLGNFHERLLQLVTAIALQLGAMIPDPVQPGNFTERLLQLLTAIAVKLGGSAVMSSLSNFEAQVLIQLEQTLVGLGGTIPDPVQPGNFEERFLQLLTAIAVRSGSYNPAPIADYLLTWTAQNSGDYGYQSGSMARLYDGVFYPNDGLVCLSTNDIFIHVRLTAAAALGSLHLWSGFYLGAYHVPLLVELYPGFMSAAGTPFYAATATYTLNEQVFTLPAALVGQNFTVRLRSETSIVCVYELQLYGH